MRFRQGSFLPIPSQSRRQLSILFFPGLDAARGSPGIVWFCGSSILDVHQMDALLWACSRAEQGAFAPRITDRRNLRVYSQPRSTKSGTSDGGDTLDVGIMLDVLSVVERDSSITQRSLSRELGIALGLANAYLKRCARKGLIKVRQAPLNRYAYYLTPKGFAEKSRLTAEYLSFSFNFFRDARDQCEALFRDCAENGMRALALAGDGDLAEIAVLSAGGTNVEIVCVIDSISDRAECAGRPLVSSFKNAQELAGNDLDLVVVTDVRAPQDTHDAMCTEAAMADWPAGRVLAPEILRISRSPAPRSGGKSK